MRQCHEMAIEICWQQRREEGGDNIEWVWLCIGCVTRPIQEMRFAVAWAVFYGGLVEYVCSVVLWVLCVNCGMGCGLSVARRHLTANCCP